MEGDFTKDRGLNPQDSGPQSQQWMNPNRDGGHGEWQSK
jgi:hypothetical protein